MIGSKHGGRETAPEAGREAARKRYENRQLWHICCRKESGDQKSGSCEKSSGQEEGIERIAKRSPREYS